MFYENGLKKFKIFIYDRWGSDAQVFQQRYVFLEDKNEIVTLHGSSIEPQPFANATDKTISIWKTIQFDYPNEFIMEDLRRLIRFNPIYTSEMTDMFKMTFVGGYDLNLVPMTSVTSSESLAPSITVSDQIYITDLATKSSPTYFLDQFTTTLWISFLAAFLLCGIALHFGNIYLKKFTSQPFNTFSWYSLITQQGGDETLRFHSRNIILLVLGITTIIFHGSFEAFLSSSLAVRNYDIPFSDLNGLVAAQDYTICTIPNTAAHDYLKSLDRNIRHNTEQCPLYFRQFEVVSKTSGAILTKCPDGKFAYMGFGTFWNNDWNAKCNLSPLAAKHFQVYVTINMSPGFKYREHFNIGILRLRSGGHLDSLVAYHDQFGYFTQGLKHGRYKYIDNTLNVSQSIDISQIVIIQMMLLVGLLVSMIVLLVEILIKKI